MNVKRVTKTRFVLVVAMLASFALPELGQTSAKASAGQKKFATAKEAADALIAATSTFDEAALKGILGPNSYDLIYSGEPAFDRQTAVEFGKMGQQKMTLVPAPGNKNLVMLNVGDKDWPCPMPIVKKPGGWVLDTEAGRQEVLYRRIGRNELDAIKLSRGFVEAQQEYAEQKHDGAPVNQYAQRIISSPGKQDGLAWINPDGSYGGSIGEKVAVLIERGYTRGSPYHGYYFKVLTGQGPAAPLGQMNFVIDGYMIGGFAMVAFPSQYRVTGVKTFIVSHDGVVYEKDLGPNTVDLGMNMELFNPDKSWTPVLTDEDDDDDDAGDETDGN